MTDSVLKFKYCVPRINTVSLFAFYGLEGKLSQAKELIAEVEVFRNKYKEIEQFYQEVLEAFGQDKK